MFGQTRLLRRITMTLLNCSCKKQRSLRPIFAVRKVAFALALTLLFGMVGCGNPFSKASKEKAPSPSQATEVAPVTPAPAQSEPAPVEKCSIAILDFTIHTSNVPAFHRQFDTNLLTDKLISALAQTRKFRIVERERVDNLLKEFKLSDQGFTSKQSAVDAGHMLGADYLAFGSISDMSVGARTEDIPYTREQSTTVSGRLSSDTRVVDSRTGEIVAAWKEDITQHHSTESGADINGMYGQIERDLADRLAVKIIEAVYPIKVASIGPDQVLYLNRGQGSGLNVGDRLEVYQPGEPIVDPDTHEVLGGQDILVGVAKVTDVQPRVSLAKIIQSSKPIAVGSILKHPREKAEGSGSGAPEAPKPKLNW
jgi:curli biogenesis system outer membrane secretion channel CsgG